MNKKYLITIILILIIPSILAHTGDDNFDHHNMMGYIGMGFFGWIFMGLVIITMVLLILWLIKQLRGDSKK